MGATSILCMTRNDNPVFRFINFPTRVPGGEHQRFMGFKFLPFDMVADRNRAEDDKTMFFISDEVKVFMTLFNGMYHFWHDTVPAMLYQLEKTPDALFIFDTANIYDPDKKYIDFFKKLLIEKNVKHRFIHTTSEIDVVANNFYVQTTLYDDTDAGNRVFNLVKPHINNIDAKPFRKIYISRSFMPPRNYEEEMVDGPGFKNDNRVNDEKKLEAFFEELGFEIVVPETKFELFEDQINYFYEAETVVHLTGGGGTNAMFMRPGSNVIELVTSMVISMGSSKKDPSKNDVEEALHHFYAAIAFNKQHNYVAIQNNTREVDLIIEKIKTNKMLDAIFKGV
jgi:hypothetical protein